LNITDHLVALAREVVDELVASLPDRTVEVEEGAQRSYLGELALTLRPSNERAAPITVHVRDGVPVVDLVLGEGGFFEIRTDQGDEPREIRQRILRLAAAAIEGNYSETVWKKRGDVVRSHGTAIVGGNPVRVSWRQLFSSPLQRARRTDLDYAPYTETPLR
jgi:hypothetical protein